MFGSFLTIGGLIAGILSIVVGVVIIVRPKIIAFVIGIYLIVMGLVALVTALR